MPRKPNHELTKDERQRGQINSKKAPGQRSRIRQEGWFIDAARFIIEWRLQDGKGHPPDADLKEYLKQRGWTAERGGEISVQEIARMLDSMDPDRTALPATKAEWWNAQRNGEIIPGTEITTVAIDPKGWLEFRQAQMDGWTPSWRKRRAAADDDGK